MVKFQLEKSIADQMYPVMRTNKYDSDPDGKPTKFKVSSLCTLYIDLWSHSKQFLFQVTRIDRFKLFQKRKV